LIDARYILHRDIPGLERQAGSTAVTQQPFLAHNMLDRGF
jgi:hypothetical protein